jgi:uncharacterized protein (TIGR02596 family)
MRKASPQRGFTLVELLVVMAIMAILGALTVPAIISSLRGSALTQGAQKVLGEITTAHQTALAQNRFVEVRFYQLAKAGMPGETAGNPGTGKFRAVQSFIFDSSGNATALDKVQWLPDTVIMDSNITLSTLLGAGTTPPVKTWTTNDPKIALPNVGTSYNALAFQFQPDGSTNLNPIGQQWFLTLHSLSAGDNLAALPTNFIILQIDALNGHVQNYRPQ